MQLPVYAYGQPVLKKVAKNITKEELLEYGNLIEDMFTTMYNTNGVGLAAPQIGQSIRLFVVDTIQVEDNVKIKNGIKKAFINAEKIEEGGKWWSYEEGCLSFPDLNGSVERQSFVTLKYVDEDFNEHIETFDGFNARVILHEYDHLDGILFVEKMKPLKRRMINKKLEKIRKGEIDPPYPMRFYRGR
ncbi:MAG TPA: peptide deformylase [Bacteroidetes bacterium]|nr:peptide deformylase [Bacteroidota bacterium]